MSKETLKEKWSKVKTKAKETAVKAKDKTLKFVDDHPAIFIGAMITGAVGMAALNAKRETSQKALESGSNVENLKRRGEPEFDPYTWNEKYAENYNKVNEFADTLKLEKGEMFIIEDHTQYDDFTSVDHTRPIVSHLVDGVGIYPDE